LIVRWPKHIRAGSKSEALYTPIDHLPTLASLCGLEIPPLANGIDLSGHALGRKATEPDAALMIELRLPLGLRERDRLAGMRGVRTKQYTYVRWLNGAEELYDNATDPYQFGICGWTSRAGRDGAPALRLRTCCTKARRLSPGYQVCGVVHAEPGHGTECGWRAMKTKVLINRQIYWLKPCICSTVFIVNKA